MNRKKAIDIYLAASNRHNKPIKVIMRWDQRKTIDQNCLTLRLLKCTAEKYCKRFGLTYKKKPRIYESKIDLRRALILWRAGATYVEIAARFGVTPQNVYAKLKNYEKPTGKFIYIKRRKIK